MIIMRKSRKTPSFSFPKPIASMPTKVTRSDSVKSDAVLKRTKATKLDIVTLEKALNAQKADTCRDLELQEQRLQMLDERTASAEDVIQSINHNIGQCQNVIVAVKETLETHSGELSAALKEVEERHERRCMAIDGNVQALGELVRSIDEKHALQHDAALGRLQHLEETIPPLEARLPVLEARLPVLETQLPALEARLPVLETQLPVLQEKLSAAEEQLPVLGEQIRRIEKSIAPLQERLPLLESRLQALEGSMASIEQFQQKINARIINVMRMSMGIIGALVVTAIVLAMIFFKY